MQLPIAICLVLLAGILPGWLVVSPLQAAGMSLGMLPNSAPDEIQRRLQPLAQHLAARLGTEVEPHIVTDFPVYEKGLAGGTIDISYANPFVYLRHAAHHEALVLASKGQQGAVDRGLIIIRADSPIKELADLRGHKVSITGRNSAYGFFSQKLSLLDAGIVPEEDLRLEEAVDNKIENVIFSVYLGDSAAGFIREDARNQIDRFVPPAALKVLAPTAPLPGWVVSVRRSLDERLREKLRQILLDLPPGDPVLQALQITSFSRAKPEDFVGLRRAMGLTESVQP